MSTTAADPTIMLIIPVNPADALSIGHTLRALARAPETIPAMQADPSVRERFARVGDALVAGAQGAALTSPETDGALTVAAHAWGKAERDSEHAAGVAATTEHAHSKALRSSSPDALLELTRRRENARAHLEQCCAVEERALATLLSTARRSYKATAGVAGETKWCVICGANEAAHYLDKPIRDHLNASGSRVCNRFTP